MGLFSTPNDKVLARRAARTRRSRWLSKLVFAVVGLGLMTLLRLHPHVIADAIIMAQSIRQTDAVAENGGLPFVRSMPTDKVTVNRGGAPRDAPPAETQSQADAIRAAMQRINAGG